MTRLDRLSGVAHDLGHHAQSGLSWLYPHLGPACEEVGILTVAVDLLSPMPYPTELRPHEPLAKALATLREKLTSILALHDQRIEDLTVARLEFRFPHGYGDGSIYAVTCTLEAKGRRFERTIPFLGAPQ
jgi:hypothetical protein